MLRVSPAAVLEWLNEDLDRCRRLIAKTGSPRQWTKTTASGSSDVVTETDLAVEAVLVESIRRHLPEAGIVSEESMPDVSALNRGGPCFVIDPIDGSAELAAGRPGFAIAVALFDDGAPVSAVLDLPAHDQRFACVAGSGAFLNGRRVVAEPTDSLGDTVLAVSATQLRSAALQAFWQTIGARALVPTPGFAAKCAAVLAGDCHGALYLAAPALPAAVWDYAAPAVLLREAEAWFGSGDGEEFLHKCPLSYTGSWVVAPPRLRERLLAIVLSAPSVDE
jgi:myo-inositol-1(or 4)-monophosphatase